MSESRPRTSGDLAVALAVFAGAWALYAATASPYVACEDVGEFQTLGATGGIAHAGYPLLTLALQAAYRLAFSTPAWRANLVSATAGALGAGLLAWATVRATRSRLASFAAAAALTLSATLWRESTRAEVYAFSLPLAAMAFLALRAWDARGGAARAFAFGLMLGVALGAHLGVLALGTVAALLLLVRGVQGRLRSGEVAAGFAGLALGLSSLLLLTLQDRPGAPMNYLETSFDRFAPLHIPWANDPVTRLRRMALLLSARQYLGVGWFHPFMDTGLRLRALGQHLAFDDLPLLGIVLAPLALVAAALRRSRDAVLLLSWIVSLLGWLAFAAFPNVTTSFFLPGLWALAWGLAIGVAGIESRSRAAAAIVAALLVALPLGRLAVPLPPGALARHAGLAEAWREWPGDDPPGRPDRSWEDFARGSMAALPPRAIVLTCWNEGTTLLYVSHALRERTDVDVRLAGDSPGRIALALSNASSRGIEVWATFAPTHPSAAGWRLERRWLRGALWRWIGAPADSGGAR